MTSTTMRCGYVALLGEPNVGKSTLMNRLLGQKLSIASSRPQTTRQRVLGIHTTPEAQVIFLDTPGAVEPKYLLHQRMVSHIESAIADADVLVLLVDASTGGNIPRELSPVVERHSSAKPTLLALNKADKVYKPELLPMISRHAGSNTFREVVPLSALTGDNTDALMRTVVSYLPEQPALYPEDMLSEHPERFFVAEFIREQVFHKFREEVPYATAVEIREFQERDDGKTYIAADIVVERQSQKGILIGKRGNALKAVGSAARAQIESFIQRPVYLELHVKVREKWRSSESLLDRLGYTRAGH